MKMSYKHPSGATKRKSKSEDMLSLENYKNLSFVGPNPAPKQSQPSEFIGQRSQDAFNAVVRKQDRLL